MISDETAKDVTDMATMPLEGTEPATDVDLINEVFKESEADDLSALSADDDDGDETAKPEEDQGQPRDESGRFASTKPAEETRQPQAEQRSAETAQDDRTGHIPAWRLREEAEAKRELQAKYEAETRERQQLAQRLQEMERRFQEAQPKPKPEDEPDPLIDPQGYARRMEEKFTERLQNQQREFDLRLARSRDPALFDEAYKEAQQALASGDQQLRAMMNSTSSPGETLLNWYRSQKTMREVGGDPNAWLEKKLEERLNDPAFLQKAMERARSQASGLNGQRPSPVQLPPSLSRTANAVSRDGADDDGGDPIYSALRR